ncbi:receptor-transporting protein 3-like [Lissotriton helveticus]
MGKDEEIWDYYFKALMFREKLEDSWSLRWENRDSVERDWGQYEQQAFGRFNCSHCANSWTSVRVWILFQMKLEKERRRGTVKMHILKQKCNSCRAGVYEEPEFTVENINIILNNLLISILESCYGKDVEDDELQPIVVYGSHRGPHQPEHCTACQQGICDWTPSGNKASKKPSSTDHASDAYQRQYPREPTLPLYATNPVAFANQPDCNSKSNLFENQLAYRIMKTSAAGTRNGTHWTHWKQLNVLDFEDDLALVFHKHLQL